MGEDPLLGIEMSSGEQAIVLRLSGELDIAGVPRLQTALAGALNDGARHVVIDLARLRFIDSMGIHVLVATHRRLANNGGELHLRRITPFVKNTLKLVGVDSYLNLDE